MNSLISFVLSARSLTKTIAGTSHKMKMRPTIIYIVLKIALTEYHQCQGLAFFRVTPNCIVKIGKSNRKRKLLHSKSKIWLCGTKVVPITSRAFYSKLRQPETYCQPQTYCYRQNSFLSCLPLRPYWCCRLLISSASFFYSSW